MGRYLSLFVILALAACSHPENKGGTNYPSGGMGGGDVTSAMTAGVKPKPKKEKPLPQAQASTFAGGSVKPLKLPRFGKVTIRLGKGGGSKGFGKDR